MKKFSILNFQFSTQKGFTLVELMVVIGIIGILSTVLMVSFTGIRARNRDVERKSNLKDIQFALELYRTDKGGYPIGAGTFSGCGEAWTVTEGTSTITYMSKIPCDPLKPTDGIYLYLPDGCSGTLCSSYKIQACLENEKDKDTNPDITDCPIGRVGYEVKNP